MLLLCYYNSNLLKNLNFLSLSSKYRLKNASLCVENISVQSISSALSTAVRVSMLLTQSIVFAVIQRHESTVFVPIIHILVQNTTGNANISKTSVFFFFKKLEKSSCKLQ